MANEGSDKIPVDSCVENQLKVQPEKVQLEKVQIEVVYASQPVIHEILSLKAGASVKDALKVAIAIGFNPFDFDHKLFEPIEVLEGRVGIFGKVVPLNTILKSGDRVEIYRPLCQDPMEARRKKAKAAKRASRGGPPSCSPKKPLCPAD